MHAISVAGFVEESAFLGEYHNVDKTGQSGMLYCETSLGVTMIVFCARVTHINHVLDGDPVPCM